MPRLLQSSDDAGNAGVRTIYNPEQFRRVLRDLDQKRGIDLLSAPTVTTKSGQRAVIDLIREFRYPTEFDPPNARSAVATPSAFATKNLGIELEVEPTARGDDRIDLRLRPQITDFDGFINYGGRRDARTNLGGDALKAAVEQRPTSLLGRVTEQVINQPVFSVRRTETSLTLRSGQTALVGGLSRPAKSDDGPPHSLFIFVTATFESEPTAPPPQPTAPKPSPAKNLPYGTAVAGKPGFVTSPFAPYAGPVDIRGFPPGTEVKDPYTEKFFLVP